MPINDLIIWFALGTVVLGLDKVNTYPIYGSILILVSVIGLAYGIREHFRDAKAGWSGIVAAFVIVVTWGAIAYDIYDHHYGGDVLNVLAAHSATLNLPEAPMSDDQLLMRRALNALTMLSNWDNYPYQEFNDRTFSDQTLLLDGKRFINCTFVNVHFVYQGTAPFEMMGRTQRAGHSVIGTDARQLKMMMNAQADAGAMQRRPSQRRPFTEWQIQLNRFAGVVLR